MMQKVLSHLRRAVEEYKLIEDGDKIAVGVSGGKDSLVLLKALANYAIFSPQKFSIVAITIDMFAGKSDFMHCNTGAEIGRGIAGCTETVFVGTSGYPAHRHRHFYVGACACKKQRANLVRAGLCGDASVPAVRTG